jgi:hypothetical protein
MIMRRLLWTIALLPCVAAAAEPTPYEPLAFLAGHCWKGTFADRPDTDEHCFEKVYGEHFLRDRHVVHGDAHADYVGETIYFWNSAAKRLEYLYIENGGGLSRGAVATDGDALVFPDAEYIDRGKISTYRARWTRDGADAYVATTEFKGKDGTWTPGWSMRMTRTR